MRVLAIYRIYKVYRGVGWTVVSALRQAIRRST